MNKTIVPDPVRIDHTGLHLGDKPLPGVTRWTARHEPDRGVFEVQLTLVTSACHVNLDAAPGQILGGPLHAYAPAPSKPVSGSALADAASEPGYAAPRAIREPGRTHHVSAAGVIGRTVVHAPADLPENPGPPPAGTKVPDRFVELDPNKPAELWGVWEATSGASCPRGHAVATCGARPTPNTHPVAVGTRQGDCILVPVAQLEQLAKDLSALHLQACGHGPGAAQ